MSLDRYNEKRDFKKTPEPAGKVVQNKGALRFVIQKHAATRLHYDFRLELGGVLLSWAVPKGPSLNPADKRLAVHVEDHPVQYGSFEGIIPHGEYGGGSVVVWDHGTWHPEGDAEADYKRGNLKFRLDGEKCQGSFALVRMHGPRSDDGKNWLLLKHADEHASEDGERLVRDQPESVQTGRTVEQVAEAPDKMWRSNRGGQKGGEQKLSAEQSRGLARKPKPSKAPAAPASEEESEDVARKRLGLAPRAAARTTARAGKTAAKSASKTGSKTASKTAAKSGNEAASKTAAKSASKTAAKSGTKSATKSAAKSATKTAAKSGTKTASKSGTKTAAKSATKSASKSAAKSGTKAASKSAAKSGTKAASKSAAKSGTKATSKTAAKSGTKAASKSATKTASKTAAKSGAKKTAAKKTTKAAAKKTTKTARTGARRPATRKTAARTSDEPAPAVRATPARRRARLGEAHLPAKIEPELATLVEAVPAGPEWLHEIKYDGYRLVARVEGERISLLTRGGEDWSARFPWLVEALRTQIDVDLAMLDGELVHLGADGVTRFGELQRSLSEGRHDGLVYFVFDVLHLQGLDLRGLPLDQRKQALHDLLPDGKKPGRIRLGEHILGQGGPLFTRACKMGLEGVVSKRRDAPYKGGRHRDWLKIKCGKRQEVVVGGFTPARSGSRAIGALLLGLYDDRDQFVYCGKVGSGFNEAGATSLRARLDALQTRTSPFAKMPPGFSRNTFVRPEVVVEISFTDWTSDGRMRHPVFEGVREDKPPKLIRREQVVPVAAAAATAEAESRAAPAASRRPGLVKKPPAPAPRRRGGEAEISGVRISHPDRVLYPADNITKRDIAEYYAAIAEWMLPWTVHRPISVVRCPDDITKPCFFQKHIHHELPPGVGTADLDDEGGHEAYIYVDKAEGFVGLTQVGTLEVHIWGSTIERPGQPDRFIIDLDPDENVPWARVKETAAAVRTRLEDLGLTSFLKTTGGKGLHVVAPLTPGRQDWDQVKAFTRGIALEFARAAPDMFTATATKAKRTGRIYMDYLRNYRGSTSVAPYSTRARPGAPVSVPLRWDELAALESSYKYTIKNLAARLKSLKADPWKDMTTTKQFLKPEVLRAVIKR